MPRLLLCLLLVHGASGCPDGHHHGPQGDGGFTPVAGQPVVLQLAIKNRGTDANAALVPAAEDRFQLTIVERDGQLRFVASRDGIITSARAQRTGNNSWRASEQLRVKQSGCASHMNSVFDQLTVELRGTAVSGTSTGTIVVGGEAFRTVAVAGTVGGSVDTALPALTVTGGDRKLHPLDPLSVQSTHLLDPGTTLTATAAAGSVSLMPASGQDSAGVVRFVASGPLTPDTTYSFTVASGGKDLLGRDVKLPEPASTQPIADRAEDGFESGDAGVLVAFEVVGSEVLPPLAGMKSLFLERSGEAARFTARLAVAPGDKVLRASYRHVGNSETNLAPSNFLVAQLVVPGGASVGIPLPRPEKLTEDPVSRRWLGPITTIEVPLPAGVGKEVILDMSRGHGCATPFRWAGFQLDDLRIE